MTIKSKHRGNEIIYKDNKWVYLDTGLDVKDTHENTPCGHCGRQSTKEGHDACAGTLIGIMNACCGHGVANEAYIQFYDNESIHGKDAIAIIEILKKYSNKSKIK